MFLYSYYQKSASLIRVFVIRDTLQKSNIIYLPMVICFTSFRWYPTRSNKIRMLFGRNCLAWFSTSRRNNLLLFTLRLLLKSFVFLISTPQEDGKSIFCIISCLIVYQRCGKCNLDIGSISNREQKLLYHFPYVVWKVKDRRKIQFNVVVRWQAGHWKEG